MILLLACAPDDPAAEADPDVAQDGDTDDDGTPDPAALDVNLSDGECPDLSKSGTSTFSSGGEDREVRVIFPEAGGEDRPVLFVWHPLGGTARNMVQWLDLVAWAEANATIVVVPSARASNLFEWDFWTQDDYDATLYDDLRTCLKDEVDADMTRVSSTGMSAGALWTSWLGMHRGDTLATILPMSGGVPDGIPSYEYATPEGESFPALLFYGGESDTYDAGGIEVDFAQGTLDYAEGLHADGHFVVLCNHDGGHSVPRDAVDTMAAWLPVHQYGVPSPFAQGDLVGLSDTCAVYAP